MKAKSGLLIGGVALIGCGFGGFALVNRLGLISNPGLAEAEFRALEARGAPTSVNEAAQLFRIPEDQNAAEALMPVFQKELAARRGEPRLPKNWFSIPGIMRREAQRFRKDQIFLAELERALGDKAKVQTITDWTSPLTVVFPELSSIRRATIKASDLAVAEALDGDRAAARRWFALARRLSYLPDHSTGILGELVSRACISIVRRSAHRTMSLQPTWAADFGWLDSYGQLPSHPEILWAEAYGFLAISRTQAVRLGFSFEKGITRDQFPITPPPRDGLPGQSFSRSVIGYVLREYRLVEEDLLRAKSWDELSEVSKRFENRVKRLESGSAIERIASESIASLPSWINAGIVGETRIRLARLYREVLLSKNRTGSFPASLDGFDLLTGDPFASEKPLRYERTAKGFRIWSVGVDRVDDGGKSGPAPENAPSGMDLVVTFPWEGTS